MDGQAYITVKEAAAEIGVSEDKVRVWCRTGQLSAMNVGDKRREFYRISRDDWHDLVSKAIKAGTLCRGPCQDCGATVKTQGHHEDYTKPLDVIWLCSPCHYKRHHSASARRMSGGKHE